MGVAGDSYRDTVTKAAAALPTAGGTLTGWANFSTGVISVVPGGCTVTKTVHAGEGDMAVASGRRSGLFEIEFTAAGELGGAAAFKWRHRGGDWQINGGPGFATAADVELTDDAAVASGQHVQFSAGPGGGDDFSIGDTYSFTPSLEATFTEQAQKVSIPLVTPAGDYDDILLTCVGSHAAIVNGPYRDGSGAFTTGKPRITDLDFDSGLIRFRIENEHATDPVNGVAYSIVFVLF
jgi:hypothetical protein